MKISRGPLQGAAIAILLTTFLAQSAKASLGEAQSYYQSGQYFRSARYAFSAKEENPAHEPDANSWIALSLIRAGLYQSASYFFIRTLQSGNKNAIARVLPETQTLLVRVGGDVLRKYLIRHTHYENYDSLNRSAYLYALGKEALLLGQEEKALGYLNGVDSKSGLWPFVLQLRGSAHALLGRSDKAIADFQTCVDKARSYSGASEESDARRARVLEREAEDLRSRCQAGMARTLYQLDRFEDADSAYDRIPKTSLVWPDILFEQAWNAFGRNEFNRTLGKLVSYKSPALSFMFNSEVDVLRAQTLLALCQYEDANDIINEFNGKYAKVGEEVKKAVESRGEDLGSFYELGKSALRASLYSDNEVYRMMNRFVRGPYFQNLVQAETELLREKAAVARFSGLAVNVSLEQGKGFPGFIGQVLDWRLRSIRLLGGAFVKNSMMDYHEALISDFEKMAFIKLEMLKRSKDQILRRNKLASGGDRSIGNMRPSRADYQYYWNFNGEFWNDELGDYVFGLESQCNKGGEHSGGA